MLTTDVIKALRLAANVLECENDIIDGVHEYAQKYGGTPGSNVFRFLLEDALRLRAGAPAVPKEAETKESQ